MQIARCTRNGSPTKSWLANSGFEGDEDAPNKPGESGKWPAKLLEEPWLKEPLVRPYENRKKKFMKAGTRMCWPPQDDKSYGCYMRNLADLKAEFLPNETL